METQKVALVTGASRGIGRGIAQVLGAAGMTVYVTGRTHVEGQGAVDLPGTVAQTAAEVSAAGGEGIAVLCDHGDDAAVRGVFDQIAAQHGRLDVLVNNVWGGYEHFNDGTEFWNETGFWSVPFSRWDRMFQAGVRAHYVASALAAPLMIAQASGLIVTISFFAAQRADRGVAYGAAKAASDQLARCMAHELRPHGVTSVALYPGLVSTEAVLKAGDFFDLSNAESPQFIGRAVAALAADPEVLAKSGQVLVAAQLGLEYGFTDIDGRQPVPLTVADS